MDDSPNYRRYLLSRAIDRQDESLVDYLIRILTFAAKSINVTSQVDGHAWADSPTWMWYYSGDFDVNFALGSDDRGRKWFCRPHVVIGLLDDLRDPAMEGGMMICFCEIENTAVDASDKNSKYQISVKDKKSREILSFDEHARSILDRLTPAFFQESIAGVMTKQYTRDDAITIFPHDFPRQSPIMIAPHIAYYYCNIPGLPPASKLSSSDGMQPHEPIILPQDIGVVTDVVAHLIQEFTEVYSSPSEDREWDSKYKRWNDSLLLATADEAATIIRILQYLGIKRK